jgi:anthranilate synthase component 2
MIYIVDNYDSFTYNLVDLLYKIDISSIIIPNDKDNIELFNMSHLIISPGPSHPQNSGISIPLINKYYKKIPILGVCLGHQAIGELFHCNISHANEVMHGKVSLIYHNGKGIFKSIPSPFKAVRYHSLVIKNDKNFNENLEIIAWTEKNGKTDEIMAIQHKNFNLFGVQFHPESILTEFGETLMNNFVNYN